MHHCFRNGALALILIGVSASATHAQTKAYQPSFFISGSVQRPGEYPYRQRMTLLHAVIIAGGYYRASDAGLRLERDAAVASGDLKLLYAKKQQALAREARLRAEASNDDAVSPTANSADEIRYFEQELSLFNIRRQTYLDEINHLNAQIVLFQEEIASLKQNISAQSREANSIQRELKEVRGLVERGMSPTVRLYLPERGLAQVESKQHELETYIVRAKQNIDRAEQAKAALVNQRYSATASELQKTQNDLGDIEKRIETTRLLLMEAEGVLPSGMALRSPGDRPSYEIISVAEDGLKRRDANEETLIEPGDIIRIQMPGSNRLSPVSTDPGAEAARQTNGLSTH